MVFKLSTELDDFYQSSIKTAAKEKYSRNKLFKLLERAKKDYAVAKESVSEHEKQEALVQGKLTKSRDALKDSKSRMKKYHDALQKMDLTNSDGVMFDSEGDCSFVIDNKEFHFQDGEDDFTLIPMREYKKEKRNSLKDQNAEAEPELHIDSEEPDSEDFSFLNDFELEE